MVAFIDQHRATSGVEPICAVLPIAPSTYFLRKAQQQEADALLEDLFGDTAVEGVTEEVTGEATEETTEKDQNEVDSSKESEKL